jgi:predicted RNA-binding protein YlxR (DUF448 family)
VGCGQRDAASAMVRLVVADDGTSPAVPGRGQDLGLLVAFDLAGSAFGRGAHIHPTAACLAKAPRGLARAFKRPPVATAALGRALVEACDRSMTGLLLAARRLRSLAVGADAAVDAAVRGAPLLIVAVDAGAIAKRREVEVAVAEGRAVAWRTKCELGALIGEESVAICAVRHEGIAGKFKSLRAAADAAALTIREGEGCKPVPGFDREPEEAR